MSSYFIINSFPTPKHHSIMNQTIQTSYTLELLEDVEIWTCTQSPCISADIVADASDDLYVLVPFSTLLKITTLRRTSTS